MRGEFALGHCRAHPSVRAAEVFCNARREAGRRPRTTAGSEHDGCSCPQNSPIMPTRSVAASPQGNSSPHMSNGGCLCTRTRRGRRHARRLAEVATGRPAATPRDQVERSRKSGGGSVILPELRRRMAAECYAAATERLKKLKEHAGGERYRDARRSFASSADNQRSAFRSSAPEGLRPPRRRRRTVGAAAKRARLPGRDGLGSPSPLPSPPLPPPPPPRSDPREGLLQHRVSSPRAPCRRRARPPRRRRRRAPRSSRLDGGDSPSLASALRLAPGAARAAARVVASSVRPSSAPAETAARRGNRGGGGGRAGGRRAPARTRAITTRPSPVRLGAIAMYSGSLLLRRVDRLLRRHLPSVGFEVMSSSALRPAPRRRRRRRRDRRQQAGGGAAPPAGAAGASCPRRCGLPSPPPAEPRAS